jgi:DNA-directed RNA polymerase specialized sigma24 family protein
MAQMNDEQTTEKLDRALRLLAAIATRGLSQTDQIALLDRTGFAPKEIAEIVGTTSNTVRVSLVSIRRAATQGKRRRQVPGLQEGDE